VGGVRREHVLLGDRPGHHGPGRRAGRHQVADLGEPGLHPDRQGVGPAELDAVVLSRIVAGGEHRARVAEVAGGEVELVGGGQADQDHVGAGRGRAVGERPGEVRRAGPHVVANDDGRGPGHLDERGAGAPGEVVVELVGHDAADVVRLEDPVEHDGVQR